MNELIADIETLDTAETAVIYQVGIVAFNGTEILEKTEMNLCIDEQLALGRTVDADTLLFHCNNIEGLRNSLKSSNRCIEHVYLKLKEVIAEYDVTNVWSKGNFDFNLLKHLFQSKNLKAPWTFWQERELRTLMKECNVEKSKIVAHTGLQDCIDQINQLNQCREVIKRGLNGAT
jgi:hypothetical protein